jgi:hypothetical protein
MATRTFGQAARILARSLALAGAFRALNSKQGYFSLAEELAMRFS